MLSIVFQKLSVSGSYKSVSYTRDCPIYFARGPRTFDLHGTDLTEKLYNSRAANGKNCVVQGGHIPGKLKEF